MVIVGYQGIGKSTLASHNHNYIDLESSSFWVDGKRNDNWYKEYVNVAEHLSNYGYDVFVSSHEVVREELKTRNVQSVVCFPTVALMGEWLDKLFRRYLSTHLEKDKKALLNAIDRYEDNITELLTCGIEPIEIFNIDYDLDSLILNYRKSVKNKELKV